METEEIKKLQERWKTEAGVEEKRKLVSLLEKDFVEKHIQEWNQLGKNYSEPLGNDSYSDLGGIEIDSLTFKKGLKIKIKFNYAKITNCNFECDSLDWDFSHATLINCRFSIENFEKVNFQNSTLEGCRFTDILCFSEPDCRYLTLKDCVFENCTISMMNVSRTVFKVCTFRNVILEIITNSLYKGKKDLKAYIVFEESSFIQSKIIGRGGWSHISFWKSKLRGMQFRTDTNFEKDSLKCANFIDADLTDADFSSSNLIRASFGKATLQNTNLSNCNLLEAGFAEASLLNTIFDGSNLEGATFDDSAGEYLRNNIPLKTNLIERWQSKWGEAIKEELVDLAARETDTENAWYQFSKKFADVPYINGFIDLRGIDLSSVKFNTLGSEFYYAFSYSKIQNAEFNANQLYANFRSSQLSNCIFNAQESDMLEFERAALSHCSFIGNRFAIPDFAYATLEKCSFSNFESANLKTPSTQILNTQFIACGVSFSSNQSVWYKKTGYKFLDLSGSMFINSKIDFRGAWASLILDYCDLRGISFIDQGNIFDDSLKNASCVGANFSDSRFIDTNLSNINFTSAILKNVKFSNTNLQNANFENADLRNTDFRESNITGANFTGAKMEGAIFK